MFANLGAINKCRIPTKFQSNLFHEVFPTICLAVKTLAITLQITSKTNLEPQQLSIFISKIYCTKSKFDNVQCKCTARQLHKHENHNHSTSKTFIGTGINHISYKTKTYQEQNEGTIRSEALVSYSINQRIKKRLSII